MTLGTAKGKAGPQHSRYTSKWTCTLCSTVMAQKDIAPHKQGKRHIAALRKVDETLREKFNSECFKVGGYNHEGISVKSGNGQAGPTATSSSPFPPPKTEASAPPAPNARGKVKSSAPSKSQTKGQKKKGKAASKKGVKSNIPPSFPGGVGNRQLDDENDGSFMNPFPYDSDIDNLDWSICDKDCGWCGKCMDEVSL